MNARRRSPVPIAVVLAALALVGGWIGLRMMAAFLVTAFDMDPPEFKAATRTAEQLPAVLVAVRAGGRPAETDGLLGVALASQAERNWNHPRAAMWQPGFGELIERLRDAGTLPDGAWQAYARESVDFRLQVVDRVPRGSPIMCRLAMYERIGPAAQFRVAYRASFLIDETIAVSAPFAFADADVAPGGHTPWFGLAIPPTAAAALADGPHSLAGTVEIDVFDAASATTRPAEPVAHRQARLYGGYTQFSPGVNGPAPAFDAVARSDLSRVRLTGFTRGRAGDRFFNLDFEGRGMSDAHACSVWLRQGGREWLLADGLELSPVVHGSTLGTQWPLDAGPGPGPAEIVLLPAAARPGTGLPDAGVRVARVTLDPPAVLPERSP